MFDYMKRSAALLVLGQNSFNFNHLDSLCNSLFLSWNFLSDIEKNRLYKREIEKKPLNSSENFWKQDVATDPEMKLFFKKKVSMFLRIRIL